jgi:putative membrane-bound dehydrogenase-like protein
MTNYAWHIVACVAIPCVLHFPSKANAGGIVIVTWGESIGHVGDVRVDGQGIPRSAKIGFKDTADKDYKAELAAIPPKEPADALKTFRLRPGFRIELVAAEPLLRSPVAVDFDENGRLFVVEFPEYNQYANKSFKGKGVVRLLEDTDGDGRYDKSTVYVDNLDAPAAVACYDGGVFVGVVPNILYCKDARGTGMADVRRTVFTGFARDAAGEAMLNSFRWGLDNRFHVSTSLSGGNIRRAEVDKDKPVSVRGHGFAFDPRTRAFQITGGGGQHGMSMDDWGRTFVCANSEPMSLVMYDSSYLLRNPYLTAQAAAVHILPGGNSTPLFRISPVEPWRALRTRLRKQKIVPGSDEGGDPAGFFTSATGITVYRGDAWPEQYRGNVLVGEVAGNLVFRALVEPQGVGLKAQRADAGVEFLASSDIWFRPVQFANGPDGALYIVDMYRELIEGAAFLPPQVLKHLDVSRGINRGRIYRIVPENFKRRPMPKLGKATTAELVALLEHANGWHRDTAARLLYQRQDRSAVEPLKRMAAASRSSLGRTHALYALAGLSALDTALVLQGLDDADPHVREQALRLAETFEAAPAIRARLEQMTGDPDLRVRYQLAFTLGSVQGTMPNQALARLARRDGGDPWFRLAVLSSVNGRSGEVFRLLISDKDFRSGSSGRALLSELAGQIGAANRANEVAAVIKAIDLLPGEEQDLARDLVRSLVSKQSSAGRTRLSGLLGGKAGSILGDLVRSARVTAVDDKRPVSERVAAVRTLHFAPFAEVQPLLTELLKSREPVSVQTAVFETLGSFDQAEVAALTLKVWPGLSPQVRATAAETLFSRPVWIAAFLDAVAANKVNRGDIDPARIKLLQGHPDAGIRSRAAKLFAQTKLAGRAEVVAAYQQALKLKGDKTAGKAVFAKNCAACHRLEGVGTSVGADLSAIRNRGVDAVLLNILDPNREVLPQFLSYVLVTDSGRTITGMISAESATSITLRRPDGTSETVLRIHIEELRSTGVSYMPEGLEKQIDVRAMADLLAYLMSIK